MSRAHRFAPALLLAAGLFATPACASGYYAYQSTDRSAYEQRAYDNGYREGIKQGERDGRRGDPFSFQRHGEWRDADDGYHRRDGDVEFYRRVYRRGFETGYAEGFNRFGRPAIVPGPPVYAPAPRVVGSPAADIGYRDGLDAGRDAARHGDRFDPVRERRYRSADHDYDRRYGSVDEFKRIYRDAFQRGYEEGYRGYRR